MPGEETVLNMVKEKQRNQQARATGGTYEEQRRRLGEREANKAL